MFECLQCFDAVCGAAGRASEKNWVVECMVICLELQTCIWPRWCHCHSLSLASVKSRLVLPLWYRLTRVVSEKGPFNFKRVCMYVDIRGHYWCMCCILDIVFCSKYVHAEACMGVLKYFVLSLDVGRRQDRDHVNVVAATAVAQAGDTAGTYHWLTLYSLHYLLQSSVLNCQ